MNADLLGWVEEGGDLGGVWFTASEERLTAEEIELAWPGLINLLSRHPGVAFVVVATDRDGPVAIGRSGLQRLLTGEVEGVDPLAAFGPEAREDFLRASRFPHAPDIYLNSMYDERVDEVAAFEELVGCHGGLGGWQTRAVSGRPSGGGPCHSTPQAGGGGRRLSGGNGLPPGGLHRVRGHP